MMASILNMFSFVLIIAVFISEHAFIILNALNVIVYLKSC